MAALDWILVAVLLASLLLGLWRGFVFEVLSLGGWVVAFLLARALAEPVGAWLPMADLDAGARYAAGLAIVFIVTAFACGLVASLLRRAVVAAGLRPVDRTLGGAFGLLRGALVLVVAAAVVQATAWRDADWWRASVLAPWAVSALEGLRPLFPAAFADFLVR